MSDHREIPPEEWDGRYHNIAKDICEICGADVEYIGDVKGGFVRCSESKETLFLS